MVGGGADEVFLEADGRRMENILFNFRLKKLVAGQLCGKGRVDWRGVRVTNQKLKKMRSIKTNLYPLP